MPKSRRNEIGVGLLVLASAGLLAWMSLKVGAIRELGDQVRVSAVFEDAAGLTNGAAVQVAGVPVGRVTTLAVEHDKARVGLALRRDADVGADAQVRIRARSVLGEKYVELIPGAEGASPVEDGAELVVAGNQVEIDQLVNSLGPLVGSVDPEALSATMASLSDALASDPERVARMLQDLETLLHNAALASEEAPALIAEARATLSDVRGARSSRRSILPQHCAPTQTRPMLKRADAVLTDVEGATAELDPTIEEVQGLLADTRGAVNEGRAVLAKLEGSTDDIQTVLSNLTEIDKWELRRLLREEGIVVRLKEHQVIPTD